MTNLDRIFESRDIPLPTLSSQGYGFSSGHIWMWELDYEKSWAPKNWCFWTVLLEKTLDSPLDCKEIQPVHPKANQSWIFIGRTDVEAETQILWPPDVKKGLTWKDPDAGKDWWWEEKGTTENEIVGWHHRLNGHEFKSTPGVGDEQGGLVFCSPWGFKETGMTERLNWLTVWFSPEGKILSRLCYMEQRDLSKSRGFTLCMTRVQTNRRLEVPLPLKRL